MEISRSLLQSGNAIGFVPTQDPQAGVECVIVEKAQLFTDLDACKQEPFTRRNASHLAAAVGGNIENREGAL
eukprot:1130119-Pleurochrysis_carterae.AAC.1